MVLVPMEARSSGLAAQLAGLYGGELGCVGEGCGSVGKLPVEFATVEAIGDGDAQAAEPRAEILDPVGRVEGGQLVVEVVEQVGPAGSNGGGPGGNLPFVVWGGIHRHGRHGRAGH
ncbi:hypothetical protein ACF1AE_32525 [Streptomyces sp. NPDC014986]|uniref:hypothetical protein n=1 Tax=Streptomyces sp. NPDC014986 TaxID=3364934 RepID=UPI0036FC123F